MLKFGALEIEIWTLMSPRQCFLNAAAYFLGVDTKILSL